MTTTSKPQHDSIKEKTLADRLDMRTRSVLNSLRTERKGKVLGGYLKAFHGVSRRAVIVVLLVLHGAWAMAQTGTVSGTVTNTAGATLPYVHVVVQGTTQGSVSDKHGRFTLSGLEPGEHRLITSMLGYSEGSITITVPAAAEVRITMEERVVDLPAFTVQNSMTNGSGPVRDKAGSLWYIGPREMQQFAYTDVSRLLRSVPGVNVQEEDGFGLRPNIGLRGAGPERTSKITIMEDGVLVAPAAYSSPAAYFFPTVGRMNAIEVAKGSSQVRYGPLTTGGAINFISTPVPERTRGMVAGWGGSYGLRNLHAHAGTEVDRVGVLVETFQQSAEGFKELDNAGATGFEKGDHLAKLTWRSKPEARVQHAVALKANLTTETSNETYLGLTRADFGATPYRRYAASQKDRMEVRHDLLTAQYAIALPGGPKLVTTVYRTNTYRNWYKLDQVVDSSGTKVGIASLVDRPEDRPYAFGIVGGADSDDNALLVKANNRNYQSSGIQLIATHALEGEKAKHGFEVGVRLHNDFMDRYQWTDGYRMQQGTMLQTSVGRPGTESNRISSADAVASHFMYDLKVGGLGVHPGIRHEHIVLREENFGTQDPHRTGSNLKTTENTVDVIIPGISIDMDLATGTMAFAGVHRGFSPPGTNPETRPEASINYELGLRRTHKGTQLQVIGFYNDYSELLGSDLAAAGGGGTGDLFNGGRAQVSGLELFVEHDVLYSASERFRLPITVSYTYTDARFGSNFQSSFDAWGTVLEGDRIPFIALHQVNGRVALQWHRASIHMNATHMSPMATKTGPAVDADRDYIPSFTVLDIGATYRWATQLEVFATVQNLLNEAYVVSMVPAGSRPGMPRAVQGGMRFRF